MLGKARKRHHGAYRALSGDVATRRNSPVGVAGPITLCPGLGVRGSPYPKAHAQGLALGLGFALAIGVLPIRMYH